jgi:hypothetical protein
MKRHFYDNQQRLVICGSMTFYSEMLGIKNQLENTGIPCLVPKAEDKIKAELSQDGYEEFKRRVSHEYLQEIRKKNTFAILAVNIDKHGINSYIGPNTFAEIAIAFENRKAIYLYYGVPHTYKDELIAWQAKPLRGSVDTIVRDYKNAGLFFEQPPLFRYE